MRPERTWIEVTRVAPCLICGKPDWCAATTDGCFAICRRLDLREGRYKIDSAGCEYWVYCLDDRAASWASHTPVPTVDRPTKPTDANTLDRVYRDLLQLMTLSPAHRDALHRRGLCDCEIGARYYRTLPLQGRAALADRLLNHFGAEICAGVPGLFVKEQEGRRWWSLAGSPGLLIPVRDAAGRIVALKARRDDPGSGPKYLYISSARHRGPGPGSPVHVPIFDGNTQTVRLTEGELKADIATALSGMLTVAVPGVSVWRQALPILRQLGSHTIHLAFDADAKRKPNVAQALESTARSLVTAGFILRLETWEESDVQRNR